MKWNDLDIIDKADLMKLYIKNGITSLKDMEENYNTFSDGGIMIKKENRGKFTESADRAGMGVQQYARHILANKDDYSSTQIKRANFARNASQWNAYGGMLDRPKWVKEYLGNSYKDGSMLKGNPDSTYNLEGKVLPYKVKEFAYGGSLEDPPTKPPYTIPINNKYFYPVQNNSNVQNSTQVIAPKVEHSDEYIYDQGTLPAVEISAKRTFPKGYIPEYKKWGVGSKNGEDFTGDLQQATLGWAPKLANFATDMVPVVGDVKELGRGVLSSSRGNYGEAALSLGLTLAPAGSALKKGFREFKSLKPIRGLRNFYDYSLTNRGQEAALQRYKELSHQVLQKYKYLEGDYDRFGNLINPLNDNIPYDRYYHDTNIGAQVLKQIFPNSTFERVMYDGKPLTESERKTVKRVINKDSNLSDLAETGDANDAALYFENEYTPEMKMWHERLAGDETKFKFQLAPTKTGKSIFETKYPNLEPNEKIVAIDPRRTLEDDRRQIKGDIVHEGEFGDKILTISNSEKQSGRIEDIPIIFETADTGNGQRVIEGIMQESYAIPKIEVRVNPQEIPIYKDASHTFGPKGSNLPLGIFEPVPISKVGDYPNSVIVKPSNETFYLEYPTDLQSVQSSNPPEITQAVQGEVDRLNTLLQGKGTVVGSTALIGKGIIPGVPNDTEILTTSENAEEVARILKMKRDRALSKEIGFTGTSPLVPPNTTGGQVDLNIIGSNELGQATGLEAHEIGSAAEGSGWMSKQYDDFARQQALNPNSNTKDGVKMSSTLAIKKRDGSGYYTPQEILNKMAGEEGITTQKLVYDTMGSNKEKHVNRAYTMMRTPELADTMTDAINHMTGVIPGYQSLSSRYTNIDWEDVAANKEFLSSINFISPNIDEIASNPQMMKNVADYWYMRNSIAVRSVNFDPRGTETIDDVLVPTMSLDNGSGYGGGGNFTLASNHGGMNRDYTSASQFHMIDNPDSVTSLSNLTESLNMQKHIFDPNNTDTKKVIDETFKEYGINYFGDYRQNNDLSLFTDTVNSAIRDKKITSKQGKEIIDKISKRLGVPGFHGKKYGTHENYGDYFGGMRKSEDIAHSIRNIDSNKAPAVNYEFGSDDVLGHQSSDFTKGSFEYDNALSNLRMELMDDGIIQIGFNPKFPKKPLSSLDIEGLASMKEGDEQKLIDSLMDISKKYKKLSKDAGKINKGEKDNRYKKFTTISENRDKAKKSMAGVGSLVVGLGTFGAVGLGIEKLEDVNPVGSQEDYNENMNKLYKRLDREKSKENPNIERINSLNKKIKEQKRMFSNYDKAYKRN